MATHFRDWPIRRKLTALMLLSSAFGLLLSAVALIAYAWTTARSGAERDLDATARIVADNTSAALVFSDPQVARETLAALRAKPEIELACLYAHSSAAPVLFAQYAALGDQQCPVQAGETDFSARAQRLNIVVPIQLKGETIGRLRITQSLEQLQEVMLAQVGILLIIFSVSFGLSFVLAWIMQRLFTQPLLQLAQTAQRVSELRDYSLRARAAGRDEVGQLVDHFNQMLEQIGLREQEVLTARDEWASEAQQKELANQELGGALERLKELQEQLVQNEKLASLGGLVAGVAHEINTPVGVGVTAASTLQGAAANLKLQYQSGALRRSELEQFVDLADESTSIILRNLQRAGDLIHSFKQVAVDQSSGEWRRFELHSYIEEVVLSLRPKLKNTGHKLVLECPESLTIESYPGALAQIVTNFLSNSLLHAYEPGQNGRIVINIGRDGDWITLRYSDDGRGIPKDNLKRIFDPFFTTKRGSGGSGLGMHIVFNLVTQLLKGTIQVRSEPGQGTEFVVRFPIQLMRAPG